MTFLCSVIGLFGRDNSYVIVPTRAVIVGHITRYCCALLFSFVSTSSSFANGNNMVADVYEQKSNALIYTEHHTVFEQSGRHVMESVYKDPNNVPFAQRRVEYDEGRVQQYVLQQPALGISESVSRSAEGLSFVLSKGAVEKQKRVRVKANQYPVIDAGFANFMARNWDALIEGKTLKFDFASTARMNTVRLRVKRINKSLKHDASVVMFSMAPANPLVKLLVTPIELGYWPESRSLAYYKGISNLKNSDGNNFNVEIKFRKPELAATLAKKGLET